MMVTGYAIASFVFIFLLKEPSPVPVFVIFGTVQAICMLLYAVLPKKGKTAARMISMFFVGLFIFVLAGILGRNNFQLEGFFFYLFSGSLSGVIVHFAMAKIIGPVMFGRSWCGWGCWTAMVLDILPYKTGAFWRKGILSRLRYFHFGLSLLLTAGLFFGLRQSIIHTDPAALEEGIGTATELIWFLCGNGLYYLVAISLAFALKDNRAFCKYICPLTVFLKTTNRIALIRIQGNPGACTQCGQCSLKCPMSIDIPKYIKAGRRVTSSECILCMNCVAHCPSGLLRSSVGFDFAGNDHLRSMR